MSIAIKKIMCLVGDLAYVNFLHIQKHVRHPYYQLTFHMHNPESDCFRKFIFLVSFFRVCFLMPFILISKGHQLFSHYEEMLIKWNFYSFNTNMNLIYYVRFYYRTIPFFCNFCVIPRNHSESHIKHLNGGICQCPCFPAMTAINSSTKWGWDTLIPVPKRMLFTAHQHTVLWTIWLIALWQLVFSNPDRCSLT